MAKCYNTRLDGVVDNENLPVLGLLKLKLTAGTWAQAISAKAGSNCIVTGETGISFSSTSGNAYTNPFQLTSIMSGFRVTCDVDGKQISISDQFNVQSIQNGTYHGFGVRGVSEIVGGYGKLYFPENTDSVGFENCTFPISFAELLRPLGKTTLRRIILKYCANISGTLADLSDFTALDNLTVNYCALLTGDISDLNSIALTNMALANSNIGGTIESFVAKQRSLGRTTGSVGGNSAGWGKVTFNGSTANAKGTVSWTATTITMNGVTITA